VSKGYCGLLAVEKSHWRYSRHDIGCYPASVLICGSDVVVSYNSPNCRQAT